MEKLGRPVADTRESNPGEVWEENEFWFELSWRIDPDGSLGIRQYFESPYRPGEKVTVDEYYRWIFENQVPGLPEKAAALGLSPLQYMRKFGVVEVASDLYRRRRAAAHRRRTGRRRAGRGRRPAQAGDPRLRAAAGRRGRRRSACEHDDGSRTVGWLTPSRKLEVYSTAMRDWGWPEHATPTYIESHVAAARSTPTAASSCSCRPSGCPR